MGRHNETHPSQGPADEHTQIQRIYSLDRIIGKGGYGAVWAGTHHESGVAVAIKVVPLPDDKNRAAKLVKGLAMEIDIQSKLNHPGILTVREVYASASCWYIVMDCCKGDLLEQVLDSQFSEAEAWGIILDLCASLAYLHSQGFTHRDIKCENILLRGADGRSGALLADFGISRQQTSGMTDVCGSLLYVAPEVLSCLDGAEPVPYDSACDLWSLGVVIYVMLTGRPPFDASTCKGVLDKILTHRSSPKDFAADPRLKHVSAGLVRLISMLLSPDPARRPSFEDMLRWGRQGGGAGPPGPIGGAATSMRRKLIPQRAVGCSCCSDQGRYTWGGAALGSLG